MTKIGITSERFPFPGLDEHSTTPHVPSQLRVPVLQATNATAVDSPESLPSLLTSKRVGRRSEFTAQDSSILIHEVFAAQAQVAPQSETCERFKVVASKRMRAEGSHLQYCGKAHKIVTKDCKLGLMSQTSKKF